ncbi:MAG: phosphonate metabolism protein [Cereibacter sphaeroides]|uniref:Phosphonate metabolism protein n=1 Tax=Cereibacter sphaeroides TaxID=1063 RepID=A0A2W5SGA4_CERSP|nr:MAG: phosphonate metabolism protein [Cereibacter sphaeroides]
MNGYDRYAIYWAPAPGTFADLAASWLGWDPVSGQTTAHPTVSGLPMPVEAITVTPRKYGFHGTVKPPFRLAEGTDAEALHSATTALCEKLAPVTMPSLSIHRIGGFIALTPDGDTQPLAKLAARVVEDLDSFRAPPDAAEIVRRRPERLSEAQRAHLQRWGYPYVMDQFQFHLTLSGDLRVAEAEQVEAVLAPLFAPVLPQPFTVSELCLFGQGSDGMFRNLHRYTLSG